MTYLRYYMQSVAFSYWRGKKDQEVDIIAGLQECLVPFEVKYRPQTGTGLSEFKGMSEFCREHKVECGYVITRELSDFSVLKIEGSGVKTRLLKIPAPLVCYWLGRFEVESTSMFDN